MLVNENLLCIPPGVCNLSNSGLAFETYTDSVSLRTHLHVVPARESAFKTFFASVRSFNSLGARQPSANMNKYTDGKAAKRFSIRLQGYNHLPVTDMNVLCKRAGVLTPVLKQALEAAFAKCTSCRVTGRLLCSRKVLFCRLLLSFNDDVQIDFMFLSEMNNLPILHIIDMSTGYSCTVLMETREIEYVARKLEIHWINHHGPPAVMSGDLEFRADVFIKFLKYYKIRYESRPARRHTKIRVFESKNEVIRTISQRLLKDFEYFTINRSTHESWEENLPRATYLSNILYGGKRISSFEMVRGYTPSISRLPKCRVSTELIEAHHKQITRRAINKLSSTRDVRTLSP